MAGIAFCAVSGDTRFPVRALLVERTEGAPGFGDGRPGFICSGKLGDDAAGRNRDLTLVGRITLGHAEAAGMLGGGGGIRRRLRLPVVGLQAECEGGDGQDTNGQTDQPYHGAQAPVKGGMVAQLPFLQRTPAESSGGRQARMFPILSGHCSKITVGVGESKNPARRNTVPVQGRVDGMLVALTMANDGRVDTCATGPGHPGMTKDFSLPRTVFWLHHGTGKNSHR